MPISADAMPFKSISSAKANLISCSTSSGRQGDEKRPIRAPIFRTSISSRKLRGLIRPFAPLQDLRLTYVYIQDTLCKQQSSMKHRKSRAQDLQLSLPFEQSLDNKLGIQA